MSETGQKNHKDKNSTTFSQEPHENRLILLKLIDLSLINSQRPVLKLKRHDDRILKALQHGKRVKGQSISKCLFGVLKFYQKANENKSTRGIIVVKSFFLFNFWEELRIPKSPFEIN